MSIYKAPDLPHQAYQIIEKILFYNFFILQMRNRAKLHLKPFICGMDGSAIRTLHWSFGCSCKIGYRTCLDIGTIAFMGRISSTENNQSTDCPIDVKYVLKDRYMIFYDKDLLKNATVFFRDRVPGCRSCEADNCEHAEFAMRLKQCYARYASMDF